MLGQVCSRWRDIILSIPWLWSHLTLTIRNYRREQRGLNLLQYHLDNAKDVPFSLRLVFIYPYRPYNHTFDLISGVLLDERNVRKVQTLRAECAPWDWVPLFSNLPYIEHLEVTSVVRGANSDPVLSLVNFARLRHVALSASDLKGIQLPWMQITSITLKCMFIDVCVTLLIQCPCLVKFHCSSSRKRGGSGAHTLPQNGDLISLEYLEHFTWSYEPDPTCALLYPRLRFPSLRTFQWHSRSFRRPVIEAGEASALGTLITNIPSTLSSLHIYYAGSWPSSLLEHVFGRTTNIRDFHLIKCKYATVLDAFSIINKEISGKRNAYLPLLEKVTIQDPEGPPANIHERERLEAKLASYIVPMFSSRDPDKKKQFSLQLAQSGGLTSKEMRKVYISLRREQLAFNVWVDFAMTRSFEIVLERERRAKEMGIPPKIEHVIPLGEATSAGKSEEGGSAPG